MLRNCEEVCEQYPDFGRRIRRARAFLDVFNHDVVPSLGASAVSDYKSSFVVEDILSKLKESKIATTYDAKCEERSFEPLRAIVKRLKESAKITAVLPCNNPAKDFNPKISNT
ncbi:chaperonin 10-like protein [Penicillium soppii]|uniref:chaperonin 10-like protein n=1 Tax=Penicillium soppii TaxID=69789 RepID=UPI0025483433|nr:chaperonin 10-like protein [Penicillium soppii]KAJ5860307.1 chaperonin 10-like protein [Penicillium soppii]